MFEKYTLDAIDTALAAHNWVKGDEAACDAADKWFARELRIAQGNLGVSHHAQSVETAIDMLHGRHPYRFHLVQAHIICLLERAYEWLDLEMTKAGELCIHRVETPLGSVLVRAKSFVGARVAAAEMLYQSPYQTADNQVLMRFIEAVPTFDVVRYLGHGITWTEQDEAHAHSQQSALLKLHEESVARRQLRHWVPSYRKAYLFVPDIHASAPIDINLGE